MECSNSQDRKGYFEVMPQVVTLRGNILGGRPASRQGLIFCGEVTRSPRNILQGGRCGSDARVINCPK